MSGQPETPPPAPLPPHLRAALARMNAVAARIIANHPELFPDDTGSATRREATKPDDREAA